MMSTRKAMPKPKPTTSSVDEKTGATRGFEPIKIESIDPKTGATRGPAGMLGDDFTSGEQPVKKATGGRLGYRAARPPK
jgi:hypothetical protein